MDTQSPVQGPAAALNNPPRALVYCPATTWVHCGVKLAAETELRFEVCMVRTEYRKVFVTNPGIAHGM